MWQQIKAKQEQRAELAGKMKGILTKSETEKRDLTADETTQFDTIEKDVRKLDDELKLLIRAYDVEKAGEEFRTGEAGKGAVGSADHKLGDAAAKEVREQFGKYLRSIGTGPREYRALTVAGQGVVGDRPFYNQLVTAMKNFTGVREAGAEVIPSETGNDLTIPTADDTSSTGQLVGEAATDNTEQEPTLGNATLKAYKFDSKWIKVSIELLQDNAYDLEGKINAMAGQRIGRALNTYTTTGSGVGQPKGFVVAGTVTTTLAATNAVTYDELITHVHTLDPAYRKLKTCGWQFHDTFLAAVRKLKDGNGRYIWLPGEAGEPDKILNYAYTINNDMAQLGAANKVAAFGDFSRYVIRDVTAIYVVRADELFIGDGQIGYRVFSRHDATLTDASAMKILQCHA